MAECQIQPIFNAACCLYITLQNYAISDKNLQTLPLLLYTWVEKSTA